MTANTGNAQRVLIIEDDEGIQSMLIEVLSSAGFDVHAASDGMEGLRQALSWQPDVILLDLILPRLNGASFIEEYRRQPGPHAAIIGMSAAVPPGFRPPDIAVDAFISKPYSVWQVVDLVERHARQRL